MVTAQGELEGLHMRAHHDKTNRSTELGLALFLWAMTTIKYKKPGPSFIQEFVEKVLNPIAILNVCTQMLGFKHF